MYYNHMIRKKRRLFIILAIVLVLLIAAVAAVALWRHSRNSVGAGTSLHTIAVNGIERSYRLYKPDAVSGSSPVPLVVMMHGALGSAKQAESSYHWNAQADKSNFIVAYPDGHKRTWAVSNNCCGPAARDHMDDVAFITQMVKEISSTLPVDEKRIYATGISNGGAMAYRLACNTSMFAAIGPVATTMLGECPSPAPVSVIHIHGTADQTFPYSGGPGKRSQAGENSTTNTAGPAIPDLIASWRSVDSCDEPAVTVSGVVAISAAKCPQGRGVELVTIEGAGHQWPGATPAEQRLLQLDPPSTALNATETVWQFFSSHAK